MVRCRVPDRKREEEEEEGVYFRPKRASLPSFLFPTLSFPEKKE